jgi:hypothetical protein
MYVDSKLLFTPIQGAAMGAAHTGTDGVSTVSATEYGPLGTTFTSATANFAASDVGREITINGVGDSSANLTTTIASINSSTSAQLADGATTNAGSNKTWSMAGARALTNNHGYAPYDIDIQTFRNLAAGNGPVYCFLSVIKAPAGAGSEAQNDFSLFVTQRTAAGSAEKIGHVNSIQEASNVRGAWVGRRILFPLDLDSLRDVDGDETLIQLYSWRNSTNSPNMHFSLIAGLTLSPDISQLADHQY